VSALDPSSIVVVAAVIERDDCFLVTRRLEGTHLAGTWEFPGGKRKPGESDEECLVREIDEELGTGIAVGALVHETRHAYPERVIELRFYECRIEGEPLPMLGQRMQWVPRDELQTLEFPPADGELIGMLRRG
jgi:8-oxo-dGTP diphosphatase